MSSLWINLSLEDVDLIVGALQLEAIRVSMGKETRVSVCFSQPIRHISALIERLEANRDKARAAAKEVSDADTL